MTQPAQFGGEFSHTTVLLHEAIDALLSDDHGVRESVKDGIFLDGTLGRAGHTKLLLSRLGPQGRVFALDRDPQALQAVQADPDLQQDLSQGRLVLLHRPFSELGEALRDWGLSPESLSGILLDIGVSSPQIDDASRGFSFRFDGPLDMRMDTTQGETAAEFLQRADEHTLKQVIRDYGEERFAAAIAKALVAAQAAGRSPRTTRQLSELVAGAVKTREPGKDPATRTFQALRIHVNAELEELAQALDASLQALAVGGRMAVISFHSLEDRCVKQFIRQHSQLQYDRRRPDHVMPGAEMALPLHSLGRVMPSAPEVSANPRARSAVMRVAQKQNLMPMTERWVKS